MLKDEQQLFEWPKTAIAQIRDAPAGKPTGNHSTLNADEPLPRNQGPETPPFTQRSGVSMCDTQPGLRGVG
jgi:hypothetical protein